MRAVWGIVLVACVAGGGWLTWTRDVPVAAPPAVVAADGAVVFVAGGEAVLAPVPLHVAGRVAADPDWPHGFRHGWPGVVVEARFAGDRVELRLVDGVNRWRVTVDGAVAELTRVGDGVLQINGLTPGDHVLRAEKLNESWEDAVFGGVFAPRPAAPRTADRVLEVYGDSYALGYGVRSQGRSCPGDGVFLATDATRAFPALAAQALGADLDLVARSGIGLIRDFGAEGAAGRMLDLADHAAFGGGAPMRPDGERIVMIALGANDLVTELTESDPWPDRAALAVDLARAIEAFARDRAGPGGQVLLVAFGDYGADLVAAHEAALAGLLADGLAAGLVVIPELARRACDWHPGEVEQADVAALVVAAIGRLPRPRDALVSGALN